MGISGLGGQGRHPVLALWIGARGRAPQEGAASPDTEKLPEYRHACGIRPAGAASSAVQEIWDGMAGPYRPAVTVSGQRGRFRAAARPYEAGGAEDRIASALEHGHAQRPGRYAPGCAGETYV